MTNSLYSLLSFSINRKAPKTKCIKLKKKKRRCPGHVPHRFCAWLWGLSFSIFSKALREGNVEPD